MGVLFFMNYVLEKLVSMPPYKPNSCKCITSWLIPLRYEQVFYWTKQNIIKEASSCKCITSGLVLLRYKQVFYWTKQNIIKEANLQRKWPVFEYS